LLLILQPSLALISSSDVNAQTLPFKAYEPTIELRDRKSRSVYIEVPYTVETGEAERIAVDWTARGGGSGTSCNTTFILFYFSTHFLLTSFFVV
jgi:COP9 signalosome complex subunit 6